MDPRLRELPPITHRLRRACMRLKPSERNEAVIAYRAAGHTLRETAKKFHLSTPTIRAIEQRVRDYRDAAEALKKDPDNLLLLARTGQLSLPVSEVLTYTGGIERIGQLKGYTLRDLVRIPNMGRAAAEQIVKLAAERGIEIK
jgi:DNA-directed RNA polymerase alpha subunit